MPHGHKARPSLAPKQYAPRLHTRLSVDGNRITHLITDHRSALAVPKFVDMDKNLQRTVIRADKPETLVYLPA